MRCTVFTSIPISCNSYLCILFTQCDNDGARQLRPGCMSFKTLKFMDTEFTGELLIGVNSCRIVALSLKYSYKDLQKRLKAENNVKGRMSLEINPREPDRRPPQLANP